MVWSDACVAAFVPRKKWWFIVLTVAVVGIALVIPDSRRLQREPAKRYFLEGEFGEWGRVQATLSLETYEPCLEVTSVSSGAQWEFWGTGDEQSVRFAEQDQRGQSGPPTNRVIRAQFNHNPFKIQATVGTLTNAPSVEIEFKTVAEYECWSGRRGIRFKHRGWDREYKGYVPVFREPTELERAAMRVCREDCVAAGKEFLGEAEPDWRETIHYFTQPTETSHWYEEDYCQIEHRGRAVLSLRMVASTYTGGAHPNSSTRCRNFRWQEGRLHEIALAELFREDGDWLSRLAEMVTADLKRQEASWIVDGSVKVSKPEHLNQFTLVPAGIVFYFDAYEMGSYAEGRYRVFVPFAQIEPVLKKSEWLRELRGN